MGAIHPKKLKLWEVESNFEETNGQNWQRRQELLELKA